MRDELTAVGQSVISAIDMEPLNIPASRGKAGVTKRPTVAGFRLTLRSFGIPAEENTR